MISRQISNGVLKNFSIHQHRWLRIEKKEYVASVVLSASSEPSPQPSQTSNFEQFDESKEDFKVYRHRLENYFNLKNVIDGSPDVDKLKAQILINCIGSKYYQLLLCLTSPETPRDKTYSKLVTLIENHLCPQPNECIEQHKFLSRMQAANETIAQYTVALRKLSSTSQFIRGLSDPTIREKLLQEKDLTFGNATKIALALEASKLGNRVLSSSTEGEVNKVTVSKPPRRQNSTSKNSTYTNRKPHKTKSKINYADLGLDEICLRCGLNNHLVNDCQKDRSTFKCSSCHKTGHVAKVCIITLTKNKKNKSVNLVIEDNDSSCGESQFSINHIVTINNTLLQGDNNLTVPIKLVQAQYYLKSILAVPSQLLVSKFSEKPAPIRNGLPTILVSDNAAIFTSEAFTSFCQRNGIQHKTIAPGHPATNGQADRFVQTLKVCLKSLVLEQGSLREKLNKILFYYRATPFFSGGKSPAENFLEKNLRTRLDLLHFRPPRSQNPNLQPAVPPSRILRLGDRVQ
ncbi:hypothetical protein ILUMI_13450 [Ignelater luminosus]|uniref:Integrase catalytic domain-containing protein n=1 Tax=Ignelater luminosus TaxID=2038154 RepID=A0A8K0G8N3_IGNLU|nr:hypothetical protein ILUMI_13450 [Ignelater luminosus]